MGQYHDPSGMKLIRDLRKAAPTEVGAWLTFDGVVGREDGEIPREYREPAAPEHTAHWR